MDRSVAQGRPGDSGPDLGADPRPDPRIAPRLAFAVGIALGVAALALYGTTYTARPYDHFVWQAAAFLEGHAAIRYPVAAGNGLLGNAYFQDVLPVATTDGIARGLLPFPPLPAVVLLPFVALWGLSTNAQVIFTILAAIDVAICWWAVGRLPVGPVVRLGTTVFFAFGTVFWYTAQLSTTWYQPHVVAVGLTFLAIGLVLGADPAAIDDEDGLSISSTPIEHRSTPGPVRRLATALAIEPRQFVAGLLFGLACTARLTVVFGAPFFVFVGAGGSWRRRAWSAGVGAALPLLALALYDVVTTGAVVSPVYDYLYRTEIAGYPTLGYHADWGIEDPRYLLQNLGVALFGTPDVLPATMPDALQRAQPALCAGPAAVRGLFDVACPLAVPRDTGMSVLLTSPAYLLAFGVLGRIRHSRVVAGAALAVGAIAFVNLMHFSQGWVQFGYRFGNDAAPFAIVLVALGFERLVARRRWGMLAAMTLIVLSLAINLWGVLWSRLLGGDPVTRTTRLVPALLVALLALGAGIAAMLPGVQFWDTGELQAVGPLMGTAHPTGFPTYVLVGWLASVVFQPFGEPAFRMNLFSAVCVAVAAGVTVDLVRALTGWLVLGVAAGIALALTPIAWAIATHADAHSLHLAFVAILLWLLVAWDARVRAPEAAELPDVDPPVRVDRGDRLLVAAAFVFGLAVGNHSLTLLLAIPVGLYVLAVDPAIWRRGRLVLKCVGVLALTVVVVYLELPLRAGPFPAALVYGTPNTWEGFKYIVLAEQFQGSLSDPFGELPRKFGELVTRTVAQFGVFALLLPIAFLVTALRKPRYALLTGSAAAITCFFAASYVNADINRYYLGPALMAWTWLAILAAALIEALAAAAGDPVRDPALDDAVPDGQGAAVLRTATSLLALMIALALLVPTVVTAPARYEALDLRGEHAAATWTDHVLKVMEPGAVIVSWWSYSTPLWYAQRVEGRRPDLTIIDDRTRLDENLGGLTDVIDANLAKGRPVYVIRLDPSEVALLARRYALDYIDGSDATKLTRVLGPRTAGG